MGKNRYGIGGKKGGYFRLGMGPLEKGRKSPEDAELLSFSDVTYSIVVQGAYSTLMRSTVAQW